MSAKFTDGFLVPTKQALSLIAVTLVLILAGCAPKVIKPAPVYFPPPPDPARIQFLKSLSTSEDVEGETGGFFASLFSIEDPGKLIAKPYGVRYKGGKLYICDTLGPPSVIIIDLIHKTFNYLKTDSAQGKILKPINLAVDNDGSIFIADGVRQEILMYNPAGKYVGSIGKETGMKPVDVAVDAESIYVLDIKGSEIKIFDRRNGKYLRSIGKDTENASKEGLSLPTNFAFDDKGMIYVTNVGLGSVTILDKDGHFIGKFGKLGDSYGEFARPKGIAVDDQHRIWVVDGGFENVQLFDETYRLLMYFGTPPLPAGALALPAGIAITTENLDYFQTLADPSFVVEKVIFVANQSGASKISIYGFGHSKQVIKAPAGKENKTREGAGPDDAKKPADVKEGKPDGATIQKRTE